MRRSIGKYLAMGVLFPLLEECIEGLLLLYYVDV